MLLVNLKQSTRDSYPCSLTLLLKEGLTIEFQAGPGSIHLLGSYRSAVDGEETQPNLIQMKVSPATAGFSQERSDEAESEERSNCVKSLGRMANSALAARAEEDSDAYSSDEE